MRLKTLGELLALALASGVWVWVMTGGNFSW